MSLQGKHIVLGISGGIAAYKSAALLRLLIKEGAEVQVVITPNGKEFITPATLAALSGKPVVSEFFAANTGEWHSHVDLGLWADLMVVAPATANTLAKMANGIADNMLITTYLSAKEPVMVAPAMDLDMFVHPTTRRNIQTLRDDGVTVLDSPSGELASGLTGKGRMLEPELILEEIKKFFNLSDKTQCCHKPGLEGKRVIITAGPTHEKLDPVRYICNYSSGKMGFALAEEFASRGADVVLICGPVPSFPLLNPSIKVRKVESAVEMMHATEEHYNSSDVAIFAAAVADFRPETASLQKIKRENEPEMSVRLVSNPDIAKELGERKTSDQINVGFALETENRERNAIGKLKKKNLDLIVLNPAGEPDAGFNTDTNRITLLSARAEENGEIKARELPLMSKRECASAIADEVLAILDQKRCGNPS